MRCCRNSISKARCRSPASIRTTVLPARADDDIDNATNRSPYPTLHLLREASIDRAVASFPEAESIYETNMRTLRRLGHRGWSEVQARCLREAFSR